MGWEPEQPLAAPMTTPRMTLGQSQVLTHQIQVGATERGLLAPLSGMERTFPVEETLPRADRPSAPVVNLETALRRAGLARRQNRLALQAWPSNWSRGHPRPNRQFQKRWQSIPKKVRSHRSNPCSPEPERLYPKRRYRQLQ